MNNVHQFLNNFPVSILWNLDEVFIIPPLLFTNSLHSLMGGLLAENSPTAKALSEEKLKCFCQSLSLLFWLLRVYFTALGDTRLSLSVSTI